MDRIQIEKRKDGGTPGWLLPVSRFDLVQVHLHPKLSTIPISLKNNSLNAGNITNGLPTT